MVDVGEVRRRGLRNSQYGRAPAKSANGVGHADDAVAVPGCIRLTRDQHHIDGGSAEPDP